MSKTKTRLIILDVTGAVEKGGNVLRDYGPYRFVTFCEQSKKLLANYLQSSLDVGIGLGEARFVKGYRADFIADNKYVTSLDLQLLEMIFDKFLLLKLVKEDNYDVGRYSKTGGYIGWLNDTINLDKFFED